MSQIRDEIQREVPTRPHVARSTADIQRHKLEKLMKNPEKPVQIPDRPKERGAPIVPDFVRNVMGSSAGAGSGEFHVYRHLRRKEYARQHFMHRRAEWERLEDDYHSKVAENKRRAEDGTARKRAKRLKKRDQRKKGKPRAGAPPTDSEESDNADTKGATDTENVKKLEDEDKSDTEVTKNELETDTNTDREKRKEEIVDKDKAKEEIVDKDKEKKEIVDKDKVKEEIVDEDKEKEEIVGEDKVKEEIVDKDKVKEEIVDEDSVVQEMTE